MYLEIITMQNIIKSIKEKKGTLLDVRSKMEFEENHIAGAINIPLDMVEINIKNNFSFEDEKKIVDILVCIIAVIQNCPPILNGKKYQREQLL